MISLLHCHPQGQNEQIDYLGTPTYWAASLPYMARNQGWYYAASNMHGSDSWGNASAQADLLDLYTMLAGRATISSVVLVGASMGGLASLLAVALGTLPAGKVKGCYLIDAVCDLSTLYSNATYTSSIDTGYSITRGTLSGIVSAGATSLPTTANFPTIGTNLLVGNGTANVETVTTTGASTGSAVAVTACAKSHASADQVSDYSTKTSGRNPILRSTGDYAGVPFRFMASAADTTASKTTNTDAMITKLAGSVPECSLVTHADGHLGNGAAHPADLAAFVKRWAV